MNPSNQQLVQDWINSMQPHWQRCAGNVHNDSRFWRDCIHSVKPQTWVAWIQISQDLFAQQPDLNHKFPYLGEDTFVIAERLVADQPITKPYNREGYNRPVFRAAMAIKDIYAPKPTRAKPTKPSKAEILEDIDRIRARVESLFD
jgi:hypothetical protein